MQYRAARARVATRRTQCVGNLAAPKFFVAIAISAESIKKVHEGRVVLRAGETADIEVTTGDAGTFPMRCTYFGHALMGMSGRLEVLGAAPTK